MYLGYQGEKIKFYTEQPLDVTMYNLTKIEETEDEYVPCGDEYVLADSQEIIDYRREKFYNDFLATSLGNYRLKPKGYANAQQSIDTVNNIVMAFGGLTEQVAQMVIFYQTPDFSKEEECTEEWLVEHQYHPEPMTREQWLQYYVEFTQKYAAAQYKAQNA